MKHILFLLILFFSLPAFANTLEMILNGFAGTTPTPAVEKCSDDEALLKCAQDLCGPATSVPDYINFVDKLATGTPAPLPSALNKKVKSLVESTLKRQRKQVNAFLQKDPSVFFDFNEWGEYEWHSMSKERFAQHFQTVVDLSKPLPQRVKFNSGPASSEVKASLEEYLQEVNQLIQNDPLNASLGDLRLQMLSPEELKTAMLKKIDAAEATSPKPPSFTQLKSDIKNKPISEMLFLLKQLDILTHYVKPAHLFCRQKNCREALKSIRTSEVNTLKQNLQSSYQDPNQLQKAMASCTSAMMIPLEKQAQINSFKTKIPNLLENFIKDGMQGSSPHSQQSFRKYFNKKIQPHFGFEDASLKLIKAMEKIQAVNLKDEDKEEADDGDLLLTMEDLNSQGPMSIIPYCTSSLKPELQGDAFAPSPKKPGGVLLISPFSCTHQSYGEDILTHELGHALSAANKQNILSSHSKVVFDRLRNCAKDGFQTTKPTLASYLARPEDSLYTEEDTADLHAFRSNPTGAVFTCILLKRTSDKQSYTDLTLQPSSDDPHSPSLLRVMRESVYKGKPISATCKQLMDANKHQIRFEKCQ